MPFRLRYASLADLAKWDQENPAATLGGAFEVLVRVEDLKCDECGASADAVHLEPRRSGAVRFSCPDHDFGPYCVDLARLHDPSWDFLSHIAGKAWGIHAIAALRDRLSEIRRARMIEAGVLR